MPRMSASFVEPSPVTTLAFPGRNKWVARGLNACNTITGQMMCIHIHISLASSSSIISDRDMPGKIPRKRGHS